MTVLPSNDRHIYDSFLPDEAARHRSVEPIKRRWLWREVLLSTYVIRLAREGGAHSLPCPLRGLLRVSPSTIGKAYAKKRPVHHQSKPKSMQEGPPDLSKIKARQRHMKSCKGSEPIQMMFGGLNPSSSAHDPRDPKLVDHAILTF
ncbi:hypothetical protein RND71_012433 [Anisodus tanguticus]|uniref:Uncharacterized protein n=1 Tax=Anisodus tanguticus TaxID=243964 RepID=A0AAE1SF89_9SOLA|nr:hypothetical protein RND71_012433 [Anisodus tanguticus]